MVMTNKLPELSKMLISRRHIHIINPLKENVLFRVITCTSALSMSCVESTSKPASLIRNISPPPFRVRAATRATFSPTDENDLKQKVREQQPSAAAIEAGKACINDHVAYFAEHFRRVAKPSTTPRLSIDDFVDLYTRNQHLYGHHFVVHQHDHPISGLHYDLRLQFSETSSISFAIPYGLPGDPNSKRSNRMAIETRVHNVWNHLIESCSHASGSTIIWDTGEYELLPTDPPERPDLTDDDEDSDSPNPNQDDKPHTHSERLFQAFQRGHMKLRLHGVRLPHNYTIGMRLTSRNATASRSQKPRAKRRRINPAKKPTASAREHVVLMTSDSENDSVSTSKHEAMITVKDDEDLGTNFTSSNDEEEEDARATMRATNAYAGATNTIGSIHQRHWFLTLDRERSGFRKTRSSSGAGDSEPAKYSWVGPWEAFRVMGKDHERSIVTGRTAAEAMADDNVHNFVGRKMWRPILI